MTWTVTDFLDSKDKVIWNPPSRLRKKNALNYLQRLSYSSVSLSGEIRLLWYDLSTPSPFTDIFTADSERALFLSFIERKPRGALGVHRLVAMDVRQTCAGWKSSAGCIFVCCVEDVQEHHNRWTKTWSPSRLADRGKGKKFCWGKLKGSLLDSMPSTLCVPFFFLSTPVIQLSYYTSNIQNSKCVRILWKTDKA